MLLTSKGGRHLFFRRKTILVSDCFYLSEQHIPGQEGIFYAISSGSVLVVDVPSNMFPTKEGLRLCTAE